MIKKQIHTLCICRWKALQTTAVSIARKFCFMQWKIKFPTRENKVSPILNKLKLYFYYLSEGESFLILH